MVVKEEAGMCVEFPEGKSCKRGFGAGVGRGVFLYELVSKAWLIRQGV